MNSLFPIQLVVKGGIPMWMLGLLGLVSLALNFLLWMVVAFLVAYAAHKGWSAA